MRVTNLPLDIISLVPPAIMDIAIRMYVLTEGRAGKEKAKPTISSFYETSIVQSLYSMILMSPKFSDWDIRIEEKHVVESRDQWVDLWLRMNGGGKPVRIEVGDFSVAKVNDDAKKLKDIHKTIASRSSWILSIVRNLGSRVDGNKRYNSKKSSGKRPTSRKGALVSIVTSALKRKGSLDGSLIDFDDRLTRVFEIYRPEGKNEVVGVVLFRVKM